MDEETRAYYQRLYQQLSEQYSPEELVEAFVFPPEGDEATQAKHRADFVAWRKQRLAERTPQQRLLSELLRIRYDLEIYLNRLPYQPNRGVPHYLREYLRAANMPQKQFADDLDIAAARLSRIMNGKEAMRLPLAYRLERHSGDLIPALLWWKLAQRQVEHKIGDGHEVRAREQQRVKRVLYVRT